MIRKIKMLIARARLKSAVEHEDSLQGSAHHLRTVLIPRLEAELKTRELEYMTEQYLKDIKHVR